MKDMIKAFAKDETGSNAIEYSLIAAIIAVGLIAILPGVDTALRAVFTDIKSCLEGNC